MKKLLICFSLMALLMTLALSTAAYDVTADHAVFDFKTTVEIDGQTYYEGNYITNNTIGGDGTVSQLKDGNVFVPGTAGTGIIFVSYLKPNTWGALDYKVNLDTLRYVAIHYKAAAEDYLYIYFETDATDGANGVTYGAGVIQKLALPATGDEYQTVVAAGPATATGELKHWRVDSLNEGAAGDLYIDSFGFFADAQDATVYYAPTADDTPENVTPESPETGLSLLATIPAMATALIGIVVCRKKR